MANNEDITELWEDALDKYEKMAPDRSRRDKYLLMTLKTLEELEAYRMRARNHSSFSGPSMESLPAD